jgi:hypothetical protein
MRLGFIGTGSITSSVVTGLVKSNWNFHEISLSPRNSVVAARLAELNRNIRVRTGNQAVLEESEVVFLAVRPQIARDVDRSLSNSGGDASSLPTDCDDGSVGSAALAGRSGADLGPRIETCAQLGAQSIGRPFGQEGITLCLGLSRKVDPII